MDRSIVLWAITVIACLWLGYTDAISSMSIDLGSESMKVGVVLPQVPMEVALNGHAKRKSATAIGFRGDERVFGSDAINMASTRPNLVYQSVPSIIGKHIDHPIVKLYRERHPYHNMSYDETTGQLIFHHPEGMSFTAEELVAMLIEYARDIAEKHSESVMRTCVVTVPSFYGQAERRSLARAVQIAGMELQQLINDNTAIALNFGIFRRSLFTESAQYFMFFDMGYTSTTATIVSYHVGKHHQTGVAAQDPILTILGVGAAPTLGTSSLIYRLRDYFAQKFSESASYPLSELHQNARAMSRLQHEASRVLLFLSANTEANAQVDQVVGEKDFRLHITRGEMETLCAAEFDALRRPFSDALTSSGIDLSVIQDIVLVGGGTRIPKVQELLMGMGQRKELGKGLNNDEAAVMGAVYQAAFHTPGFRVLPFVVKDYNPYPIAVDFERLLQSANTDDKSSESAELSPYVRRMLFPRGNPFPQKRAITFNRYTTDLTFYVNYADLRDDESRHLRAINLTRATTEGATQAAERNPGSEMRGIKAHLTLDYSGLLTLTSVDCLFHPLATTTDSVEKNEDESTFKKLGDTISGFFGVGGNSKKDKAEKLEEQANTGENDATSAEQASNGTHSSNETMTNGTSAANETARNVNQSENQAKVTGEKLSQTKTNKTKPLAPFSERIGFKVEVLDAPAPSAADIQHSISKLRALNEADRIKRDRERMANELESSILTMREHIESEAYIQHSTDAERTLLSDLLSSSMDWYEEQDSKTPKEVFEEKLLELRRVYLPMHTRVTEAQKRPRAFDELKKTLDLTRNTLTRMREINNLLFKLDQSIKQQQQLKQQEQEAAKKQEQQEKQQSTSTSESDSSAAPSEATAEANATGTDTSAADESKAAAPPTDTEKPAVAPFTPMFSDVEIEALDKLTEELTLWINDSLKKLGETAPHQHPPVLVEDVQLKHDLIKSKLSPSLYKLTNFQAETDRVLKEKPKPKKPDSKSKKSKSTEAKDASMKDSKTQEPKPELPEGPETDKIPVSKDGGKETLHLEL